MALSIQEVREKDRELGGLLKELLTASRRHAKAKEDLEKVRNVANEHAERARGEEVRRTLKMIKEIREELSGAWDN